MYADPRRVGGVKTGYMVGPEEMQEMEGHCTMTGTVDLIVGEPEEADTRNKSRMRRGSAC